MTRMDIFLRTPLSNTWRVVKTYYSAIDEEIQKQNNTIYSRNCRVLPTPVPLSTYNSGRHFFPLFLEYRISHNGTTQFPHLNLVPLKISVHCTD